MAGNSNSGRRSGRPFRDALNMELAALGEDSKALRIMARNLIAMATNGEKPFDAIKEIADRLDGKPAQAIIGGDENDPAIKAETTVTLKLG